MGKSYVYFVQRQDNNLIKIGTSINLRWRVNDVRLWCKAELVLLGVCEGGYGLEATLHRTFVDYHAAGREWFYPVIPLACFIRQFASIPSDVIEDFPLFRAQIDDLPLGHHRCLYCGDVQLDDQFPDNGDGRRNNYRRCKTCRRKATIAGQRQMIDIPFHWRRPEKIVRRLETIRSNLGQGKYEEALSRLSEYHRALIPDYLKLDDTRHRQSAE